MRYNPLIALAALASLGVASPAAMPGHDVGEGLMPGPDNRRGKGQRNRRGKKHAYRRKTNMLHVSKRVRRKHRRAA